MNLGHSLLFAVLLANNLICILFFKSDVRNVKCFSSGCSVLHTLSKSNLIYVNCPISLRRNITSLFFSGFGKRKIKITTHSNVVAGKLFKFFGFVFEELSGREITLENFSFKFFFVHTKAESECFQMLLF